MRELSRENDALLTILIPTYNRLSNVIELLCSLYKNSNTLNENRVNILISENIESINSDLASKINKFQDKLDITLVNPDTHLLSAEENLFFAWKFATGEYVWILGDDDPINFDVLPNLLERCKSRSSNILKYNAQLLDSRKFFSDTKVTKCELTDAKMSFLAFLQIVGMWHTGAGFSTWIFKRDLIESNQAFNWVSSFRSPVYSHVTFFIRACFQENVQFVNLPLVYYRVNDYVYRDSEIVDHWENYTNKVRMPRYFPWTFGFMEQIKRLENEIGLSRSYWGTVVGDHFGAPRFLEFNSMVGLALEQIRLDVAGSSYSAKKSEWDELVNYFESIRPDLYKFWKLWRLQIEIIDRKPNFNNRIIRRIYIMWLIINKFNHFEHFRTKYRPNTYVIGNISIYAMNSLDLRNKLVISRNILDTNIPQSSIKPTFAKVVSGTMNFFCKRSFLNLSLGIISVMPNIFISILDKFAKVAKFVYGKLSNI